MIAENETSFEDRQKIVQQIREIHNLRMQLANQESKQVTTILVSFVMGLFSSLAITALFG